MTSTRVSLAIGSSDHAANASVPPRTGTSTSPGPVLGIGTVTRPTAPTTLCSASDSMSARPHCHRPHHHSSSSYCTTGRRLRTAGAGPPVDGVEKVAVDDLVETAGGPPPAPG